ncbi:MAG: cytidylate kinase family protein [Candidatus Aenigmarchaeota archaeon]|nr:cytidylate kinase family protein [Candidatus Aenigmarchaeota archaeon]
MRITISGKPGAGKTTVGKRLAEKLGLKFIELGKIAQKIALRRKLTIGELMQRARTDHSIDDEIDGEQKNLGKKQDNFVIDGRISWFFIPNAVHIFLDVKEQAAAERIFKKPREQDEPQYKSVGEVQKDIHNRLLANKEQYLKYYKIDYLDKKNYDFVINTTNKNQEQVLEEVMNSVKNYVVSKKFKWFYK